MTLRGRWRKGMMTTWLRKACRWAVKPSPQAEASCCCLIVSSILTRSWWSLDQGLNLSRGPPVSRLRPLKASNMARTTPTGPMKSNSDRYKVATCLSQFCSAEFSETLKILHLKDFHVGHKRVRNVDVTRIILKMCFFSPPAYLKIQKFLRMSLPATSFQLSSCSVLKPKIMEMPAF